MQQGNMESVAKDSLIPRNLERAWSRIFQNHPLNGWFAQAL